MYFTDTLRGLWRRWYIVLPGMLIAASLAIGAWNLIPPGYERSSTLLLIPGPGSMPDGSNPYLFLGGLTPAADVIVRAVGSENLLTEVVAENPGVKIEVFRDTMTAGPVILIVVTAPSNAAAEKVLGLFLYRTAAVLDDIQETEGIATQNRITVSPITVDSQSVLQERNRFIAVGAAGFTGMALTLLIAGLAEGLSRQRKSGADAPDNTVAHTFPPNGAGNIAISTTPTSAMPTPQPARAFRPFRPFRSLRTTQGTPPPAISDEVRRDGEHSAPESTLRNLR